MVYAIALCGLTAKDSRLLETVINRAPHSQHSFRASQAENSQAPHIVIVDASSPASLAIYKNLREHHPKILAVTISDHGMAGDTRYRIERRYLFLRVMKVLEDLVKNEFVNNKVSDHPALAKQQQRTAQTQVLTSVTPVATGQSQPLNALIVDDSLTAREQVRAALERLGITCDLAENAEAAMQLLTCNYYSLAFLDVVMPGTDGYELCRIIKQNSYTRLMPVLLLTSRSSPFDRARGALSGCDSYQTKPINWDTFSQAVDKILMKSFRNDRNQLVTRGYRR